MDGFLIINKEKGYTSFDVCNKIKHKFNEKHVGHTGTLDPNACGVLVVSLGKACKTLNLINDKTKEYLCTIEFNRSYDTIDPTGKLTGESNKKLTIEEIKEKLEIVSKMTKQVPPAFSALKVNGKRSYDLARKGVEVVHEARDITIYNTEIRSDLKEENGLYYLDIYLRVSRGFYVRSFVKDLCDLLSVCGNMYNLTRLSSGFFDIGNSKKIDEVKTSDVIKIEDAFNYLDNLEVKDYLIKLIENGVTLDERQIETDKPFIVTNKGKNIAIYQPVMKNRYKRVVLL